MNQSRWKCPNCGRVCKLNRKLSDLKNRDITKRFHHYECDGQNKRTPHPPIIYKVESLSVMTDNTGRIISKINKVTQLWIEDSNIHELMDQFKSFMEQERYKRLPEPEITAV